MQRSLIALLLALATPLAHSGASATCDKAVEAPASFFTQKVMVLGEVHGTKEIPRFVEQLTCQLLARDKAVTVALEIPSTEQSSLDAFMQSSGADADRKKMLSTRFWSKLSRFGTNSEAMADLISALRKRKSNGQNVELLAFDYVPSTPTKLSADVNEMGRVRDQLMADYLARNVRAAPQRVFLVLTGNYHATKRRENAFDREHRAMAHLLSQEMEVLALNLSYEGGTAWNCTRRRPTDTAPTCGPSETLGSPIVGRDNQWYVRLFETAKERTETGFDGEFSLGKMSASPPAVPE